MVTVHIDHDRAVGTLTTADGGTWSVTVTEHPAAGGTKNWRITQSDGSYTTGSTSRISAILVMLHTLCTAIDLEYPDRETRPTATHGPPTAPKKGDHPMTIDQIRDTTTDRAYLLASLTYWHAWTRRERDPRMLSTATDLLNGAYDRFFTTCRQDWPLANQCRQDALASSRSDLGLTID